MRTLHNPRVTILSRAGLILAATLLAAACAPAGAPSATGPSAPATTAGQACAKGALPTVAAGTLTVGTDQPVYQPWYVDDKPENGQGFESAVAYAIADQLGYPKDKVAWTRVPFNAAIQPGPKPFDLNLTEFSITDERKQAVDFSAPYYDVKQAVVALSDNPFAGSTNLAGLAGARLGAQVGTTSYDAINDRDQADHPARRCSTPTTTPSWRCPTGRWTRSSSTCPTAFFITSAELQNAKIVGQLPAGHRHARAVRRRAGQGQPADVVRVGGGGRAAVGGDAGGAGEAVADGGGQRPRADVTRGRSPCPTLRARAGQERLAYRRSRARRSTARRARLDRRVRGRRGRRRHAARPAGRGSRRRSSTPRSPGPRSRRSSRGCGSTSGCWSSPRSACSRSGLLIAVLRTLRGPVFFPLRALATGYVDLFRGVPLLIALYLIGFGVPALRLQGVPTSAAVLGTITLILVYSAYVAEVFRAGIESIHPSQRAAARSLGLTHRQSMRLVILPQAVRRVLPPLLNDFVALQKDVGLISVLGAVDAIRAAQIASARTFNFTPYVVAAVLFVLLAVPTGPDRGRRRRPGHARRQGA